MEVLDELDPDKAVVWSFGLGNDMSWEVGMACRFDFTISLFDAAPGVSDHVKIMKSLVGTEAHEKFRWPNGKHAICAACETYWSDVAYSMTKPSNFVYRPVSFAEVDGNRTFHGPGSWSLDKSMRAPDAPTLKLPVQTLRSLLRDTMEKHIDVLKADVDGVELKFVNELLLTFPVERLPRVIILDMDTLGACDGEKGGCKKKREEGTATIARLQALGYKMAVKGVAHTFFK